MGYTHYWNFSKNPKDTENGDQKFAKAVKMLSAGIAQYLNDIKLGDSEGYNQPIINETSVIFNGSAENDEDYETFHVVLDDPKDYGFNFCKTARMPYDSVVCLALLCFKEAFGDDFEYSSDGYITDEGWQKAHEVFDKIKLSNAE